MTKQFIRLRRGTAVFAMAMISVISAAQSGTPSSPNTPKDEFLARVNDYLELRKKAIGVPIKPATSSKKINSQRQHAAQKMLQARGETTQGNVFTPAVAKYFREQLALTLSGPEGKRVRATLRHSEPVKKIPLAVNQHYPISVPLQSTPPSLLLNLPQIPQELEYRIVGRALVLRDTGTNLIVDFIADALPPE